MLAPRPIVVLALSGSLASSLAGSLAAQTTWFVANHTEFLAALQNANPGDTVQLAAGGVFQDFALTKGLTLRGPATIGGNYPETGTRTVSVPPGQIARFVDLRFLPNPIPLQGYPPQGELVVTGLARFDGCELVGSRLGGGLVLRDADVVVQRCSISGHSIAHGIEALDSHLSLVDSAVTGSDAYRSPFGGYDARPAIGCRGDGSLLMSACTVRGGNGTWNVNRGGFPPHHGVVANVPAWITDTTIRGGSANAGADPGPFPGGDALVGSDARFSRCTLIGGPGQPDGRATSGNAIADPLLLGASSSALARGAVFTLTLRADAAGVPVAVLASLALQSPAIGLPWVAQPQWLGGAPLLIAFAATGATHELALALGVPADPILAGVAVDFVGLRAGATRLEASAIAGGVIR